MSFQGAAVRILPRINMSEHRRAAISRTDFPCSSLTTSDFFRCFRIFLFYSHARLKLAGWISPYTENAIARKASVIKKHTSIFQASLKKLMYAFLKVLRTDGIFSKYIPPASDKASHAVEKCFGNIKKSRLPSDIRLRKSAPLHRLPRCEFFDPKN